MTNPAPARRKRRTDSTRARLLEAALEVFTSRGYDAASLAEITTRADLGAGTLYLHFRDKRDIYEEMVRQEGLALRALWLEAREANVPAEDDVIAEVRMLCEVILDYWSKANPALMRLVLLDGPAVETWFVEDVGRVIAPVLAEHVEDAELLANMTIGALLAAGRFRLTRPEQISNGRLIDMVAAFCAGGIAAEPPSSKPKQRRKR